MACQWPRARAAIIGPFTATSEGYRYAQIVMDTFSKYAIFIPMRRQDETTTADALFYEVFMTRGPGFPSDILSDKGSNYMSAVVTRLCTLMEIHKVNTSPYNPQSNGKNENSHRFLLSCSVRCDKQTTLGVGFVG